MKMEKRVNMKFTKVNMLIVLAAILLLFPFAIEIIISSAYRPIPLLIFWSLSAISLAVAAYLRGAFKKPKTMDKTMMDQRFANGLIAAGGAIALSALLDAFYYPARWNPILFVFSEVVGVPPVIAGIIIHIRSRRK
ncbi:MAG: hypothetical protein QXI91_07285 [Candidatus Bathyarchaeia archaeon]